MLPIAILGDLDSTGELGSAITSVNELGVTYMGTPVAIVGGATVTETHTIGHDSTKSATPLTGSPTVTIAGRPIHRVGDQRSCGTLEHVTVTLEPRTVFVGPPL